MDNSFDRQRQISDKQQQTGFWGSLQIFERILNWLAGIIRLTEDEQRAAGIYVGSLRDE